MRARAHRNVGLVIETRPDEIDPDELRWLRTLGVTKVQLGAQSLDDRILSLNKRGHDVQQTRDAVGAAPRRGVQGGAALDAQPSGGHSGK